MPFKLFSLFTLLFSLSFSAFSTEFVEGRHYKVLDLPKAKQKEIREYFSFYCSSCYSQQNFMKELERGMPRRTSFVKNHIEGIEGKNPEIEVLLTKAVITAEKMRMKDKVIKALFDHTQKQKADFKSLDDIRTLFIRLGGSEFMFDSTFNSFSMDMKLEEAQNNVKALAKVGEKNFPLLIINGRYKPLTSRITSMAQYKDLIYHLLTK